MVESKLMSVFFPKEEAPFYRKAIVAVEEASWFLDKGAVLTGEEAMHIVVALAPADPAPVDPAPVQTSKAKAKTDAKTGSK